MMAYDPQDHTPGQDLYNLIWGVTQPRPRTSAVAPARPLYGSALGGGQNDHGNDNPDTSQPRESTPGAWDADRGYIDMGPVGRMGMTALGMVPGPIGMIAGAANLGIRANNIGIVDSVREQLGMEKLGFGQKAGAMLGLNDYAKTGLIGDLNIGGNKYGVSLGGMLANDRVGLTPEEAQARQAHANMAGRGAYKDTSAPAGGDGPRDAGGYGAGEQMSGSDGGGISDGMGGGMSNDGGHTFADGGSVREFALMDLVRSGGDRPEDVSPRDWERISGEVQSGDFIVPADVVSALGNGTTDAGAEMLSSAIGGHLIQGNGDGRSDSVPSGSVLVSRGEFRVPREVVRQMGGSDKLHDFVVQVRDKYRSALDNMPGPRR